MGRFEDTKRLLSEGRRLDPRLVDFRILAQNVGVYGD
jgi:hypothetical protein